MPVREQIAKQLPRALLVPGGRRLQLGTHRVYLTVYQKTPRNLATLPEGCDGGRVEAFARSRVCLRKECLARAFERKTAVRIKVESVVEAGYGFVDLADLSLDRSHLKSTAAHKGYSTS